MREVACEEKIGENKKQKQTNGPPASLCGPLASPCGTAAAELLSTGYAGGFLRSIGLAGCRGYGLTRGTKKNLVCPRAHRAPPAIQAALLVGCSVRGGPVSGRRNRLYRSRARQRGGHPLLDFVLECTGRRGRLRAQPASQRFFCEGISNLKFRVHLVGVFIYQCANEKKY